MNQKDLTSGILAIHKKTSELYFILGNKTLDRLIWCMDKKGRHCNLLVDEISIVHSDCNALIHTVCDLSLRNARNLYNSSNHIDVNFANAAWWMGWYYEDANIELATWFYILAIRINRNVFVKSIVKLIHRLKKPFVLNNKNHDKYDFMNNIVEFNSIDSDTVNFGSIDEAFNTSYKLLNQLNMKR